MTFLHSFFCCCVTVLKQHWSTFITEGDFRRLSSSGVNVVRVPIGWWMIYDPWGGASKAPLHYYVTPTNFVVGGLTYLDRAFDWAAKYGIGIIVDMHAAPGSQNGNDNSAPPVSGQVRQ